jgi:hypothetical protein
LSWCDRLASTPGVGFQLTPMFVLADIVKAWSPIMDPLVDAFRNPTFTTNDNNGTFTLTTRDGFAYSSDHTRVSCSFVHRMKATAVSGGPPIMEMLSTPRPYTELLPEVSRRLVEATRMLPNVTTRKIFQVGVVSTTRVSISDAPPGIARFIRYLERPWGSTIRALSVDVTPEITKTEHWTDRCLHRVVLPENREELMTLVFDFHRQFNAGQTTTEAQMRTLLNKCGEDALDYFEKLAEGSIFDEHLISTKTS